MGRLAAIDWGRARIGIALSDERRILATPLPPLLCQKTLQETIARLLERLAPYAIDTIIIGWPLHLDGRESPSCKEVQLFAKALEQVSAIPVELHDERLTTAEADRLLKESGLNRKKRKSHIDSASAVVLLQSLLERL